jgi:hypothetical protein
VPAADGEGADVEEQQAHVEPPLPSIRRLIHPLSTPRLRRAMTGIQLPRQHQPQAEVDEAADAEDAASEQARRRLQ